MLLCERPKIEVLFGDGIRLYDMVGGEHIVVTDPPYNLGKEYGNGFDDSNGLGDGSMSLWKKRMGLCSHQVDQDSMAEGYYGMGGAHSNLGGFNMWEPILVYGKVSAKINLIEMPVLWKKRIHAAILYQTYREY